MRAPFAHTAHAPPAAAASPATARTFATAPSTRPPYGPAPPKPACATPTRVWNTTIHAMLQTLNTCTPCIAATPRRAPAPKTAQKIPSPYMERRPCLWPAPTRHTTLAQNCNACLLQMPPCPGSGKASDSPCPDHGPTNERTSMPCKPEPSEGSPSIEAYEA